MAWPSAVVNNCVCIKLLACYKMRQSMYITELMRMIEVYFTIYCFLFVSFVHIGHMRADNIKDEMIKNTCGCMQNVRCIYEVFRVCSTRDLTSMQREQRISKRYNLIQFLTVII